ncbi:MAG: fumarylacetoacetate hydrolase family protein [Candidatus Bathyarchaeota archaeon]|nr:fumarylacetoacetate hydrolase family protein [Candidatus Bathyarchaeota archaeon]
MKLVVFNTGRLGALQDDNSVIDLNFAFAAYKKSKGAARPYAKADAKVPTDLHEFILEGDRGLENAKKAVEYVKAGNCCGPGCEKLVFKPDEVTLHAPLPSKNSKIAMAGANFYDHSVDAYRALRGDTTTVEQLKERVAKGEYPPWGFWKMAGCVVGPGAEVPYPERTKRMDYEVEVAAVLGKGGKDIPEEDAMDYIYGYTIVNDLSIRDGPRAPGPNGLFYAKNFDGCAPMGPCLVTADEIGDPYKLKMKQWVNGELRQDGSMESIIRGYAWWINYLTRDMPFYPGDIICGGTCSGTAMDQTPRIDGKTDPKLFLNPGDEVEAWVEKIGSIKVKIIAKQ